MENNHASNAALAYSKYSSQRKQKEKADGTPLSTTVIISPVGEAFSKLMKVDVVLLDATGKACNVQHRRKKRRVWTLNATIEVDPPQSLRVPGSSQPLISIHGPQIFRNSSASLLLHFASGSQQQLYKHNKSAARDKISRRLRCERWQWCPGCERASHVR